MAHKRENYFPEGTEPIDSQGTDAAIYFYATDQFEFCAVAFAGRAQKPLFQHWFPDAEGRQHKAQSLIDNRKTGMAYKAEHDAKRKGFQKSGPKVKVGDIFYTSWGYEQTNVDFYQVVGVPSTHFALLRQLERDFEPTEYMQGRVTPKKSEFLDKEAMRRKILVNTHSSEPSPYFKINDYALASPHDGRALSVSSYH